ncbi:type II toxin-antitoxin system VapC family toxin [Novosphingobium sp. P6W]|uniref:type II toxin-antitoxin system VapC family toxin n=1 Tax=Novosphingobium sp. P6W TaxID=1609758 RepID=UPI0005C2BACA|nr:type II toxin-antitoxin system VapC family toxin [Novosphingobium sp. P6W]AXB80607.1 type II toxin-antitoxin system VapC family toxin [Novosphingobium sp. P6W]KIS29550.1 twitching motility protein PilT [Novosphingobium sp. P6W]
MFVDASAMTAMLSGEDDAADLLARLGNARVRITSALAIWETVMAVRRILDLEVAQAQEAVEEFLRIVEIEVVSVPPEARQHAIDAYDRYGKSRHPAALNFGDCFAYASARLAGVPLLFKGEDFPQTDIDAA